MSYTASVAPHRNLGAVSHNRTGAWAQSLVTVLSILPNRNVGIMRYTSSVAPDRNLGTVPSITSVAPNGNVGVMMYTERGAEQETGHRLEHNE
jgi:hypothetical protein